MRDRGSRRGPIVWWSVIVAGGVCLSLGVALSPVRAATLALVTSGAVALVWVVGSRRAMWYVIVASIPLRQPLSYDVHGTVSVCLTDLLLLGLLAGVAYERGIRDIWRRSIVFRIGLAILLLSGVGLFSASRVFWGIASVHRIFSQLAVFYLARHLVCDGAEARRTLLMFVCGMLPAVLYGLYQSRLPVGTVEYPDLTTPPVTWDASGIPRVRVFATFDHPLRFAHSLSVGTGIALGLAILPLRTLQRWLLVGIAGLMAWCNFFTYSIGAALGTIAGGSVVAMSLRRRPIIILVPLVIAAWIAMAPGPFLMRVSNLVTGQSASAAARLITYQQTYDVVRDHPLFGVGWGDIRETLEYDYRVSRETVVAFTSENYFLARALALGIVGLGLSLALCVIYFRNALAKPDLRVDAAGAWPRTALLAGGVTFYVQAQVIPAADPSNNYLLWLLFALAERMREQVK